MFLGWGCVPLRTAEFHEFCVNDETQDDGDEGETGGGDKSEAVELLCEIDQVSDNRTCGHDPQSDKHVQGGIELGKILLREHPKGQRGGTGEPSSGKNPVQDEKDGKDLRFG